MMRATLPLALALLLAACSPPAPDEFEVDVMTKDGRCYTVRRSIGIIGSAVGVMQQDSDKCRATVEPSK